MTAVEPYRDPGNARIIWAPKRAVGDDGTIGVGWVDLRPGDPDYAVWDRYLRGSGRQAMWKMGNGRLDARTAQKRGM